MYNLLFFFYFYVLPFLFLRIYDVKLVYKLSELKMNSPIKVLIAEDNILNQKIIAALVKRLGWQFLIVSDGKQALDECFENEYDAVLMDIDMPVMNGWEATIEIKKIKPDLPIIALTAYSEEFFREKSFASGMDFFLAKPYNHMEIERTVLKSLENR